MAKSITNWKIIRGILSSCEDIEDIDKVANILSDTKTYHEIVNILVSLSLLFSTSRFLQPNLVDKKNINTSSKLKLVNNYDQTYKPENILGDLFRNTLKMTNREVEIWIQNKYKTNKHIGKNSLYEYIGSILKPDPITISSDMISKIYSEFKSTLGENSELRVFWDKLDARERNDTFNDLQRGNSKTSTDTK